MHYLQRCPTVRSWPELRYHLAGFIWREALLQYHVRGTLRTGNTIIDVFDSLDRAMEAEDSLDRMVEIDLEIDLAGLAACLFRDFTQRIDGRVCTTAVRTEHCPLQIEQSGASRLEKKGKNSVAIDAPPIGYRKRTDTCQAIVWLGANKIH